MGGFTFQATSKAADAPEIEDGLYSAKFEGIEKKFIKGGQFGDGDRLEWAFTLLDREGAVLYDKGEPVVVTQLSSMSTNVVSKTVPKAVRNLKAILTPSEFAKFVAGEGIDEEAIKGRVLQVQVETKENGWPSVAAILPAPKSRKATPVAVDEE